MAGQGAFIFGCEGLILTPAEHAFFARVKPWGFILFGRNIADPAQVTALTGALRDAVGYDAPIFIDQEGGRVARLTAPHWREWLPALDQVHQNKRYAARSMYLRYRIIADELRAIGIDGNCAPLADIATPDTHAILHNRCYGDDVLKVAEIAGSVAQGLIDGGVLPVLKHIPGHGRATADSHLELPRVKTKERELKWSDFMAFEPLSGLPLAMTAHVVFDALDEVHCATVSPTVIDMIRTHIGFGGVLMSDDISMQALDGPLTQRSQAALAAGCDMILHCNGQMAEMKDVAAAAGPLSEIAQSRADAALTWRRDPVPIDIEAATAEFQSLMMGQAGNG